MKISGFLKEIFMYVLEIVFPSKCIFCGKLLTERTDILICDICTKAFVLDRSRRSFDIIGHNAEYVAAPFLYEEEVRNAIIKFKFNSKEHYGKTFAYFMNDTLKEMLRFEKFDLIIPVPLHKAKLAKRGYNQAAVLACELDVTGAVYAEDALIKIKNSGTQSLKTAVQRAQAVRGSFACRRKDLSGKNILLVDDICTTGVTLNYCAGILKKCGAKRVVCITAAKRHLS